MVEEEHGHWRWPWWAPAMQRGTRRRGGPSAWSSSRGREARRGGGEKGASRLPGRSRERKMGPTRAHEEKGGGSGMGRGRVVGGGAGGGVRVEGNGTRAGVEGGLVGWAPPRRERERGRVGCAWKNVGQSRRRKIDRARRNSESFDLFK
jgi:hypothetical protein